MIERSNVVTLKTDGQTSNLFKNFIGFGTVELKKETQHDSVKIH